MQKIMAAAFVTAAFCVGAQAEMPAPSLKSVAPALKAVPAVPAVPGVAGAAATTSLSGAVAVPAAASASVATPAASMPAEKADAKKKGGMMDSMKKVPVDKVIDKVM